jgi:hypothetical protein
MRFPGRLPGGRAGLSGRRTAGPRWQTARPWQQRGLRVAGGRLGRTVPSTHPSRPAGTPRAPGLAQRVQRADRRPATSFSRSLPTLRPGGSCTPTTVGPGEISGKHFSCGGPALLFSRLNNPPCSSNPKNPCKEERSTRRCRWADLSLENRPARFARADCPARAQRFAHDAHRALLASAES